MLLKYMHRYVISKSANKSLSIGEELRATRKSEAFVVSQMVEIHGALYLLEKSQVPSVMSCYVIIRMKSGPLSYLEGQ